MDDPDNPRIRPSNSPNLSLSMPFLFFKLLFLLSFFFTLNPQPSCALIHKRELTKNDRNLIHTFLGRDYLPNIARTIRKNKGQLKIDLSELKSQVARIKKNLNSPTYLSEVVDRVIETANYDFIEEFLIFLEEKFDDFDAVFTPYHLEQIVVYSFIWEDDQIYKRFIRLVKNDLHNFFDGEQRKSFQEIWIHSYLYLGPQKMSFSKKLMDVFLTAIKGDFKIDGLLLNQSILRHDKILFEALITQVSKINHKYLGVLFQEKGYLGFTALHYVAAFGSPEMIQTTINLGDKYDFGCHQRSKGYTRTSKHIKKGKKHNLTPNWIFHDQSYPYQLIWKNENLTKQQKTIYYDKFKSYCR